jgi:hypothetical protein
VGVYLLHSTVPLRRSGGRTVMHYMGWCKEGNLFHRLEEHNHNRHSAKIVQAFLAAGGILLIGRYWPGTTPDDEQRMKRNGHIDQHCYICKMNELQQKLVESIG